MFDITRGADNTVLFELFEDDEVTPLDLTGAESVEVYEETIAPSLAITDAANGTITAVFSDGMTADLKKDGRYTFRIKITFPGDEIDVTPAFVVMAR